MLQIQIQLENGIMLPVQIPANTDIGTVMQQIEVNSFKSTFYQFYKKELVTSSFPNERLYAKHTIVNNINNIFSET